MAALDDTFGVLLIGVVVAATLYGFTCMQTWYYYTQYPSDPWYIKLLVAAALVSDTLHQAMITHTVYTYLITNFGVFEELTYIVWSLIVEIFFNAFTTLLVQCFLAMRVYRLSNKSWLATGCAMVFVVLEFLASIIFGIKALGFRTFVELTTLKSLSMLVNVLSAAGDIFISGFLCYLLHASRTGFERSETLINKLIVFSINTGLLTSLCALASLISISVWSNTFIYIGFFFCIGRLYCNCLLATLNARTQMRGVSHDECGSLSLQNRSTRQKTSRSRSMIRTSKRMPNNISIKVDTTEEYVQDEHSSSGGDAKNPEIV